VVLRPANQLLQLKLQDFAGMGTSTIASQKCKRTPVRHTHAQVVEGLAVPSLEHDHAGKSDRPGKLVRAARNAGRPARAILLHVGIVAKPVGHDCRNDIDAAR